MVRFCSICGKLESPNNPLINNLCWDCYKARHKLISIKRGLVMDFCSICGSYRLFGRWMRSVRGDDKLLSSAIDYVERHVKLNGSGSFSAIDSKMVGGGRVSVLIHAHGSVDPSITAYDEYLWVDVKVNNVVCPSCLKASSKSFTSIVQVRADGRDLSEYEINGINNIVDSIISKGYDESKFLLRFVRGGMDYSFIDFKLARIVANTIKRRFGAIIKESHKVIGFNSSRGVKISKLSISVRLPKFFLGDVLNFNGTPIRYDGYSGGKFLYYDLRSGVKGSFSYREYSSNKVGLICRYANLKNGVVRSITNNIVEIANSSSSEIYHAHKPVNMDIVCGDNVKFLILDGHVLIVSKI